MIFILIIASFVYGKGGSYLLEWLYKEFCHPFSGEIKRALNYLVVLIQCMVPEPILKGSDITPRLPPMVEPIMKQFTNTKLKEADVILHYLQIALAKLQSTNISTWALMVCREGTFPVIFLYLFFIIFSKYHLYILRDTVSSDVQLQKISTIRSHTYLLVKCY